MAEPDFRALSLDLADAYLRVLEHVNNSTFLGYEPSDDPLLQRARAALAANPDPAELPPGYIDPWIAGENRRLLEVFYKATRSEGGTADEIYLRGIHAVLAAANPDPAPMPWPALLAIGAKSGYQRGHEDTVESCYGDPEEVAAELAEQLMEEAEWAGAAPKAPDPAREGGPSDEEIYQVYREVHCYRPDVELNPIVLEEGRALLARYGNRPTA